MTAIPADSIFVIRFPVLKRFTAVSVLYALSRALMYIVTSFSLVYLTEFFGYYGLWLIMIPVILGYLWGVCHFEKLEQQSNNHANDQKLGSSTTLNSKIKLTKALYL